MNATRARPRIDVNVDMGESYGRWQLGDDAAIMPYISSVSVACGFHAGDPSTIRRTVHEAVRHGLRVGAHVALPDLLGFGRRRMSVHPEELKDYCTYQIGAISAFLAAEGAKLAHVKPHGSLYVMCTESPELAGAVAEAIAEFDRGLPLLLLNRDQEAAVAAKGVRLVHEAFIDLEYSPQGQLILERVKLAWDPDRVAQRAVRLVKEGRLQAVDGSDLSLSAPTVCLHGDAPNSVEVARTVRRRLEEEGVAVTPLDQIFREEPAR
jgi:UPF0271 protein